MNTSLSIFNIVVCTLGFLGTLHILARPSIDTTKARHNIPLALFGLGWAGFLYESISSFEQTLVIYTASRGLMAAATLTWIWFNLRIKL